MWVCVCVSSCLILKSTHILNYQLHTDNLFISHGFSVVGAWLLVALVFKLVQHTNHILYFTRFVQRQMVLSWYSWWWWRDKISGQSECFLAYLGEIWNTHMNWLAIREGWDAADKNEERLAQKRMHIWKSSRWIDDKQCNNLLKCAHNRLNFYLL